MLQFNITGSNPHESLGICDNLTQAVQSCAATFADMFKLGTVPLRLEVQGGPGLYFITHKRVTLWIEARQGVEAPKAPRIDQVVELKRVMGVRENRHTVNGRRRHARAIKRGERFEAMQEIAKSI